MSGTRTRGHRSKLVVAASLAVAGIALAAYWFAPKFRSTPLDVARSAYDRGDYREARALAVKVLVKSPNDRDAMRIMARASARLGDDDSARNLFGWIGGQAMEAEDLFVLGSSLERRGQEAQAIAVLERGRKLEPDHAETLHDLSRLYARADRLPEAIDAAGGLSRCPGWEARGALILGVLDAEIVDAPGTVSAIEHALRSDPKLTGGITSPARARKILAGALLQAARPGEALAALEPVLASGPDPEASWLSSRAFLQAKDAPRATGALALAGDFGKDHPTRLEPAPYVGAGACAVCHAAIYRAQRGSRHSRTFSAEADLKSLALPDKPVPDPALPGTSHALRREGDTVRLTTRSGGTDLAAVIEFAVGSGNRGMTMVARDAEGLARVCRVSSYLDGTLWDLTSHATDPQPGDANGPLGRPMSRGAAEKCINCHVTSPRAARDRRVPEAADRGIGCERCHGPGGNHLVAMKLAFPEPAIARPSRASAEQINRLCGTCHKADDPSTSESDPRFVRFQATTLPKSRCYTESRGAMSCVTCHDPHRDADPNSLAYETRCLSCHAPTPTEPTKETRHARLPEGTRRLPCPVNPTTECLKCHMPKVEGVAPHASFTDHQIRIHRQPRVGE